MSEFLYHPISFYWLVIAGIFLVFIAFCYMDSKKELSEVKKELEEKKALEIHQKNVYIDSRKFLWDKFTQNVIEGSKRTYEAGALNLIVHQMEDIFEAIKIENPYATLKVTIFSFEGGYFEKNLTEEEFLNILRSLNEPEIRKLVIEAIYTSPEKKEGVEE